MFRGALHRCAEVFKIPGWNTYMNAASATWQFIEYKTDLGSPSGGNALYVRENWKGNPALPSTLQVYKDAVLPAGTYRLSFEMRQPAATPRRCSTTTSSAASAPTTPGAPSGEA